MAFAHHILARALPLLFLGRAFAHDPGLSSLDLRLDGEALTAHLVLACADLEALGVSPEALAPRAVAASSAGVALAPRVVRAQAGSGDEAHIILRFHGLRGGELRVRSAVLAELGRGHRQVATLRGAEGETLLIRVLDRSSSEIVHSGCTGAAACVEPPSLASFLALGVEHILLGYDHLAFLAAVLLAGGGFLAAVKSLTAFSAAHSLTLVLSAVDLVHLSPAVVEPLIALSIVYVGIENLLSAAPAGRWRLTFAFGLIHGLGFAGTLRDAGLGSSPGEIAGPLLAFNAGVELGQVAVAAVLYPVLTRLRPSVAFRRAAPAASAAILVLGVSWFIARTLLA